MTSWILWALGIYFVQTLMPPVFRYILRDQLKIADALGPRDLPSETTPLGARSERALQNMKEALLIFFPLALLTANAPGAELGAKMFVVARILYVPAYLAAIPGLRSAIWLVGVAGLAMMAMAIRG